MESADVGRTLSALRSPDVGLYGVIPECGETYQSDLAEAKKQKLAGGELWGGQHVPRSEERGYVRGPCGDTLSATLFPCGSAVLRLNPNTPKTFCPYF